MFQKILFIKLGLHIFLELSEDFELGKCLHGKTQNANESFDGTIWERIPKNTFVICSCFIHTKGIQKT